MLTKLKGSQKHAEKMDGRGAIAAAVVGQPVFILHSSKSKQKSPNKLTKGDKAATRLHLTVCVTVTIGSGSSQ